MRINGHEIHCLTFDLDDTLWECFPVIIRAEQVFYAWLSANYPLIAKDFTVETLMLHRREAFTSWPDKSHDFTWMRKRWFAELVASYDADPTLVDDGFRAFLTARNEVTLFDGVESLLEKAAARYRLGSITNGNADISLVGLSGYFDFEITASGAGAAKPDPLVFDAAIKRANVAPEHILHIGDDADRDIRGAARAGMHTVWINPRRDAWAGEDMPTFTFDTVTGIEQLFTT